MFISQLSQERHFSPLLGGALLQRKCACGQHTIAGGECSGCKNKRDSLQRSTQNSEHNTRNTIGMPPIVHEVLNSPGQPLDASTRAFFEPLFGHDFSRVGLHTDMQAAESAKAVSSLAYTVGRHIVLGDSQGVFRNEESRKTMAHELAHSIQQSDEVPTQALRISTPNDHSEREAEMAAETVIQRGRLDSRSNHNITPNVQSQPGLRLSKTPHTLQRAQMRVRPAHHCQALDEQTRAFMEPRFGHDFSQMRTNTSRISSSDLTVGAANDPLERAADNLAESVMRTPWSSQSALFTRRGKADFTRVRIHTGARAADSSRAVHARAYTVGQDIVFGPGGYAPNTYAGRRLLAHELAHTIQQSDSGRSAIVRRQTPPGGPAQAPRTPAPAPPAPAPIACTPPTSLRLGTSHTLSFPGFLTGGGICSVMEAQPAVSNLCSSVPEQVTSATGNCPASLITGGICSGSSNFTIGRNQVRACASVTMPPNGFVDRHTIQLQNTSVLHDATRNPAGLNSCSCTCDQQYFAGTSRTPIGRFQIRFDLAKGTRGTQNITLVTASKTTVP